MTVVTRFAPSPTGLLHLGSAYSAVMAAEDATAAKDGRFLLRIEDTDQSRCRDDFEAMIYEDLAWLGLTWEEPVRRQSEHLDVYAAYLRQLRDQGVTYPCFCSRKQIAKEIEASGLAPHGPDGPVYPGTCRGLSDAEITRRKDAGEAYAERLDMTMALTQTGTLTWQEQGKGLVFSDPAAFGDVVLARKDDAPAYHLAVVCDDHLQAITLITRGKDLYEATSVHRVLQALLGFTPPAYHHHRLLLGSDGKRLAKRDASVGIAHLRDSGKTPTEVRALMKACQHV